MEWYKSILKRILSGVIFFLLPIILLVFVFRKAVSLVQVLILPLKNYLPAERVIGIGLYTLVSLFVILIFCYIAGILSERKLVKILIGKVEENLLVYIPGY